MSNFFFDGNDVRVRLKIFAESPRLVITFTGRAAEPPVAFGFGEQFLEKRGISAIHFISTWNHWWQTPEVSQAIEKLKAEKILDQGVPIVLYGSSMGGYAVLRYSRELGANSLLAVSPQFSIDAKVVPFEKRWRNYAAKVQFNWDDMDSGIAKEPRLMVVVDPLFAPDWKHVQLVKQLRPVEVLATTFAGHNTARALEEIGLVSSAMEQALLGTLERDEYVRQFRSRRRYSSLVWLGLAEKLLLRGRPGSAAIAAFLACGLQTRGTKMRDRPLRMRIFELGVQLACDNGYDHLADQWLLAMQALGGRSSVPGRSQAMVALTFGDTAEQEEALVALRRNSDLESLLLRHQITRSLHGAAAAAQVLAEAPEAMVKSHLYHRALAGSKLELGDAAGAAEEATLALKQDPGMWQARALQARARSDTGNASSARKAVQPLLNCTISGVPAAGIEDLIRTHAGKAAAADFRNRSRRASWLLDIVVDQLRKGDGKKPEAWIDNTLRLLGERLSARRKRLADAASGLAPQDTGLTENSNTHA